MTYKINGTEILQPTEGKWIAREKLGIDGNGHAIYPAVREFEMRFSASTPTDYNQLMGFYNAISNTGTVVVDLPQFGSATYAFYSYSGCVLQEPEAAQYFAEHQLDILLTVTNIRT